MASADNLVVIYKELADAHERQGHPQLRDRFLVLAADAALDAGRPAEADLFMARLLRANPHHMLRPYPSFAEAMASPDIRNYVGELRRTHPPEQAEAEFDAQRARPRQTRALPPTSPVMDPGSEDEREPLKLHREQDEADAPPPPRPARPAAPGAPAPPPKAPPRPPPPVSPPMPLDEPPPPPPVGDPEETARGTWLSTGLFLIVLAAGIALAGWTFVRPFFPVQ